MNINTARLLLLVGQALALGIMIGMAMIIGRLNMALIIGMLIGTINMSYCYYVIRNQIKQVVR